MDHIWGAPSRLKKLLALIFLKKLSIVLRQEFLKTLYVFKTNIIVLNVDENQNDEFLWCY